MARIELDKAVREVLVRQVRAHLKDEAGVEIDPVDALRLLDFLAKTVGPHFYNQGLYDAEAVLRDRVEAIADAMAALARPVKR